MSACPRSTRLAALHPASHWPGGGAVVSQYTADWAASVSGSVPRSGGREPDRSGAGSACPFRPRGSHQSLAVPADGAPLQPPAVLSLCGFTSSSARPLCPRSPFHRDAVGAGPLRRPCAMMPMWGARKGTFGAAGVRAPARVRPTYRGWAVRPGEGGDLPGTQVTVPVPGPSVILLPGAAGFLGRPLL